MNQNHHYSSEFIVSEISENFQKHLSQFEQFLYSQEDEELKAIHKKLGQDLDKYYQNGILTIALIGQYSAGKSTIISALTGRRDIYIDADIATDTTTRYDWNGIKIIDTPGLYTDRTDHDQITYNAIEKSDLLVFCLTSMLLDNITADNFKKLAYDQEYSGKMMLVINKMSQASGDEQELITNYKESLAKALEPYSLESFPLSFIDAKDYCEGIDEEEDLLIELSGFSEFIQQLNQFIEEKKIISRLDTPVRITLSQLNDVELAIQRDDIEDAAYLELVNRCAKRVEEERKSFWIEVKKIALELYSKVRKEATPLVEGLGKIEDEKEWEKLDEKVEKNIDQYCEYAQNKLKEVIIKAQESLFNTLKEVLEGDLGQGFKENYQRQQQQYADETYNNYSKNSERWQKNSNFENFGKKIEKLNFFSDFVANGLLKVANRDAVYQAGKFLGIKFKPFGAVNAAKNIGNVAKVIKFAGPALAAGALLLDVKNSKDEEKQSEKLSQARKEINSQFTELAQQLQTQLESIGREVETQLYDEAAAKIEEMREAHNATITENQEQLQELTTLRQELKGILSEIRQSL